MILPQNPDLKNNKAPQISLIERVKQNIYSINNDKLLASKKSNRKKIIRIAIDGEWDSSKKINLCYTVVVEDNPTIKIIVFNEKLLDILVPKIIDSLQQQCQDKSIRLFWKNIDNDNNVTLGEILTELGYKKQKFELVYFFSPKDIWLCFGHNLIHENIMNGTITQKRNTSGEFTYEQMRFVLKDLSGWSTGSLEGLAESVGVKLTSKSNMDEYKSHMLDGLIAETEEFIDYAMGDTEPLLEIYDKFVENNQWVQKQIGIPDELITQASKTKSTIGAVVADSFSKALKYTVVSPDKQLMYDYALKKLGLIDADKPQADAARSSHNKLRELIQDRQSLIDNSDLVTKHLKNYSHVYEYEAYSQASVKALGNNTLTSGAFAAIVSGGRCVSENPREYLLTYGADIDLRSAYSSQLRQQIYPIGIPSTLSYTPNQKRDKLGKVLEMLEKDGTSNWVVMVEGKLSFSQDLIFSKLVTQKEIVKAVNGFYEEKVQENDERDDSMKHIPGDFVLSRQEIENGIITPTVLEIIEKTASSRELKEIMNLDVVTANYYLEENRCHSIEEWIDRVLADTGDFEVITTKKGQHIADTRTRAWYGFSMEKMVGGLVDKRNQLKKDAKAAKADGNHDLHRELHAKQSALKLMVNTLYGVIGSLYFPVGNTVIANKITASIRVAVWQMSKALNTIQSITDGGFYGLQKVNYLKTDVKSFRKPSLATLSDLQKLQNSDYVEPGCLGENIDWESIVDNLFDDRLSERERDIINQIDKTARNHIQNFWAAYDLDFKFDVEHKTDNFALRVAYWSKADYAFVNYKGVRNYKIRGAKEHQNPELRPHPKYELLDNILNGIDEFPSVLAYDFSAIMKIGKYKEVQKSSGYLNLKDVKTGEKYKEERHAKFNNLHLFMEDLETYTKLKKYSERKNRPQFERYRDRGIAYLHRKMLESCRMLY